MEIRSIIYVKRELFVMEPSEESIPETNRTEEPVTEDIEWTIPQQNVIAHRNGPMQVIACAGSGKTTTISRMIAEMVNDRSAKIDRNSIVAFTFTENAANQLKVSIKKEMEKVSEDPNLGEMFIGTIHKFCKELLNRYVPETLSYEVLSENALPAFVFQHARKIGISSLPPAHSNALSKKVGWFINDANMVRRENYVNALSTIEDRNASAFHNAFRRFRILLDQYHFFDFEELIYRTVKLLERDPAVLKDVRSKYRYIVVDEYQDIDAAQERLIRLLAGESGNIVVVGDDDQAIYRWRGAQVENFLTFAERHGIEPVRLEGNFRSSDLIIELSRNFISSNTRRLPKNMEPGKRRPEVDANLGDVYQIYFDTHDDELDFIFRKITELVGTVYTDTKGKQKTLRYGDIAILFRKKKSARELVRTFEERDFHEYFVSGEESLFANPESELIRLSFAYIARGQKSNITITDLEAETDEWGNHPSLVVEEVHLRNLIRRSSLISGRENEIIAGLNDLKDWYSNPTSRRIFPQKEYQKILGYMGIKDIEFPERLMYNLGQISTLLKDFETVYRLIFPEKIKDLVRYLDWAAIHAQSKIRDPTMLDAVNVMTIHAAKGMEFPVVFMPSLTKREFPNGPAVSLNYTRPISCRWLSPVCDYATFEEGEEEARRLFYVAMTRSRKFLFLSGSLQAGTGGRNRNPADFYEEIDQQDNPKVITRPMADPTPRPRGNLGLGASGFIFETSFSQLRYMYNCPYDFKLKQIYGFSPTIDSSFNYGFAVHNALRRIHQDYLDMRTFPPKFPSQDEISRMVDDPDQFHLRYAQGKVEKNLRKEAKRILWDYAREYGENAMMLYRPEVPFEYVIPIEDCDADVLLTGSIDLLERTDPNSNRVVEVDVIDFKTEHANDDEYDPRYRDAVFQVRLYALATKSQLALGTQAGYIHYLSEGMRREVELNNRTLTQVKEDVKAKVRQIMNREFPPVCNETICRQCDRRNICMHSPV